MLNRHAEPMSIAAFFASQEHQAERYELVDGRPVRLMAGARNVYDDIVVNLVAELRNALRGSGCRPFTGDGSVETVPGRIRRPDVGVDCGRRDPNASTAAEPHLVAEVLSPSTRDFDAFEKLDEYRALPTLRHIPLIEPNAPEVMHRSRADDGAWSKARIEGLDAAIPLTALGITLTMSDLYEGVGFPARPRLVPDPEPGPDIAPGPVT